MAQIALQVGAAGAVNTENDVRVVRALVPSAIAATTNGVGVDLLGYEAASVIFHTGAITDGEYTVSIEHSADNAVGDPYTTVAALDSAFTVYDSMNDDTVEIRRLRSPSTGLKRWIRVVVTETMAGTTGGIMSSEVVLGAKRSSVA
jgi:hypothetical protein